MIDAKEVGAPILDDSVIEKYKSLEIVTGKKPFKFKKPKEKFDPYLNERDNLGRILEDNPYVPIQKAVIGDANIDEVIAFEI